MTADERKAHINEMLEEARHAMDVIQRLAEQLARSCDVTHRDYEYWADRMNTLYEAGAYVCDCGTPLIGIEQIAEHHCDQRREAA